MSDAASQTPSDSYRLPALDSEFLLSPSMRGARFMMEYAKAEESLRAHRIVSTIVVFGSPRVASGDARYEPRELLRSSPPSRAAPCMVAADIGTT